MILFDMTVSTITRGDETKPAIVFVHGAGGAAGTWMMQLRGLSDNFHVIALELNGHGETPDRNPEDVREAYLKDVQEVLNRYQKPILAGHSMGGALAQLYALQSPEQIAGLVLVGTGAKLKVHPNVFDAIDAGMESYLDLVEKFMFSEKTGPDVIEASLKEIRQCSRSVIRRDFQMCNEFDIMKQVSDIQASTLIMVGEDDLMTPPKYAQYLHENIGNSELEIIPDAGHAVMVEQPRMLNERIRDWAKRKLDLPD